MASVKSLCGFYMELIGIKSNSSFLNSEGMIRADFWVFTKVL